MYNLIKFCERNVVQVIKCDSSIFQSWNILKVIIKWPWLWQRTSSGEDPALQQTGQRVREAYRQVIEPDSDEIQEEMVGKFMYIGILEIFFWWKIIYWSTNSKIIQFVLKKMNNFCISKEKGITCQIFDENPIPLNVKEIVTGIFETGFVTYWKISWCITFWIWIFSLFQTTQKVSK